MANGNGYADETLTSRLTPLLRVTLLMNTLDRDDIFAPQVAKARWIGKE